MNDNVKRASWRDVFKIHPAADLFPLMPPNELKALGEDIAKNGLRAPIIFWRANTGTMFLLDGRNRLDAMEMVGIPTVDGEDHPCEFFSEGCEFFSEGGERYSTCDPFAYVLSANVHRRHLTAEQKRDLIAKVLKAQPSKSNRTIAKQTKVDHKTVGVVREQMEGRGEIPHVSTVQDTKGRQQPARKPPPKPQRAPTATVPTCDDIGPDSKGEVARLSARIEELHGQLAIKDQRIAALEREVAEGERRIRELTRQLPAANEQPPNDGDGIPSFLRRVP